MKKRYLITGRPITKKNSSRYVRVKGRSRLLPSPQFTAYENTALWQLKIQTGAMEPIATPVSLKVEYYMPSGSSWPDLMGLVQATADILQDAGILADDGYIEDFNGTRIAGIDKLHPRAEIIVTTLDKDKSTLYGLHPDFKEKRKRK